MPKVIILQGLPGSGKSTWAKEKVRENNGEWIRINKDDLRAMLHDATHSDKQERQIEMTRDVIIQTFLRKGKNVIIDDTNLHPKHIRKIKSLAGPLNEVEVIFFNTPIEVCIARDAKREGKAHVGEKVIRMMNGQWSKWQHEDTSVEFPLQETIKWVPGLPDALICDLDGTLSHILKRSPYDFMSCGEDEIDVPVANLLFNYHNLGYKIILMSGRDAECRKITERWLEDYSVYYDHLYMRPEGDMRKDSIIKRELFDAHVRGKFNVEFVLDDRNQVVELWRQMGLKCFQVAEGNF